MIILFLFKHLYICLFILLVSQVGHSNCFFDLLVDELDFFDVTFSYIADLRFLVQYCKQILFHLVYELPFKVNQPFSLLFICLRQQVLFLLKPFVVLIPIVNLLQQHL
jgi:hypothetical protein